MARRTNPQDGAQNTSEQRKFVFERTKFIVTAVGGVVLFFIGLWQFSITSRNDFAKPILQKQLDLCIEASNAAASLAQSPAPDLTDRNPMATAYLSLYYGKLAVVEDRCVYRTMIDFKRLVFDKEPGQMTPSRAALRIAFACRRMLTKRWSAGLLGIYDPEGLVDSFNDLADFKESMNAIDDCRK